MRWMKLRRPNAPRLAWTLLPLMLAGTSCAPTGRADCLTWEPIYVSKQDVLTDGTVAAILTHNEKWRARCG